MRVAEGGVGQPHRFRIAQPAGKTVGTEFVQSLLGAGRRRRPEIDDWQLVVWIHRRWALTVRSVHRDIGEVIEDLGATVGGAPSGQQVRALLDERRRDTAQLEVGVVQNRLQEGDVRRHAPHPELSDCPAGSTHRRTEIRAPAGELDE